MLDPVAGFGGDCEGLAGKFAATIGVDQVDLGVDDEDRGVELRVGTDEIAKGWCGRVGGRVEMEDDIHARQVRRGRARACAPA